MAKCTSCGGCSGCGSNRNSTRVGALNSLCRSNDYPFYTGPCPDAPCNGCGCDSSRSRSCGSCNAQVGCNGCTSCGGSSYNSGLCPNCGCNPCTCGQRRSVCSVCGHNPCTCNNGRNYSGSTCPRCGCNPCTCSRRCDHSVSGYGVFSAGGPIDLCGGGCIQLSANHASSDCFSLSGDCIRIRRSGVYFAILTADIPADCCDETTLVLDLGGQPLVPPALAIHGSGNYAAHTVFRAHSGDSLRLTALESLSISHSTRCPVFTLTLLRIE